MSFTLIKFIHIIAAIIWIGSAFIINLIVIRLIKANEKEVLRSFAKQEKFIGMGIIAPSALLTAVTGILLSVFWFGWPFWTIWGIAVVIITALFGSLILPRQSEKIIQLITADNPNPLRLKTLKKRFLFVVIFNLLLLLSAVGAMVFKPII